MGLFGSWLVCCLRDDWWCSVCLVPKRCLIAFKCKPNFWWIWRGGSLDRWNSMSSFCLQIISWSSSVIFDSSWLDSVAGHRKKTRIRYPSWLKKSTKLAIRCSAPVDRRQNGKSVASSMRCGVKRIPKCEKVGWRVLGWFAGYKSLSRRAVVNNFIPELARRVVKEGVQ